MKVEFMKSSRGQWYWRIKARNGRILCTSEEYSAYRKAVKGFESLLNNCDRVKVYVDEN